ncbi:MAG: glucosaminidase domain-containing protein [Alphaproteobacteria bacterium]|nr:glucosaminidase domain-containing protein [Alphaproteobacteria bacterium]
MPAVVGIKIKSGFAGLLGVVMMAPAVAAGDLPIVQLDEKNTVPACVTPARLMAFLKSRNPRLDRRYRNIAEYYARHGEDVGVRWDVGFFQMMVETANLTFRRPDGARGDVVPDDNNFAGLGAVGDGQPGEMFPSIEQGVRAHLEHVLIYAGVAVPDPVADRTRKVQKWGVLASWQQGFTRPITFTDLALRWAPHTTRYAESIRKLTASFATYYCDGDGLLSDSAPPAYNHRATVGETAWRFEQRDGRANVAGTEPPTGKPDLSAGRKALGAGRIAGVAILPPKPERTLRAASFPIVAPAPMAHPTPVSRPQTASKPGHSIERRAEQPDTPRISPEDRIRQLVSDRKFLLRTHVGTVVPIVFRSNGRMFGDANGLAFFLGSAKDYGSWWVENGKLCQKWKVWLDRETHCITLKEEGDVVVWHADDGKSGTARIVAR